jgi:hypothetical protein
MHGQNHIKIITEIWVWNAPMRYMGDGNKLIVGKLVLRGRGLNPCHRSSVMLRSSDCQFVTDVSSRTACLLKMEPIGRPETSTIHCPETSTIHSPALRNIPEGRKRQLHREGSLKYRTRPDWLVIISCICMDLNSFIPSWIHFVICLTTAPSLLQSEFSTEWGLVFPLSVYSNLSFR